VNVRAAAGGEVEEPAAREPQLLARTGHARLRVLLVSAETGGGERLAAALDPERYEVQRVGSGTAALGRLDDGGWDVLLLDVELEGASGFEVCRRVRERGALPVLFVTARGEFGDCLRGFDSGVDDYVVTPVDTAELDRRILAVLRRSAGAVGRKRRLDGPDGVTLDLSAHRAAVGAQPLALTAKEFALLRLLLERRGEVLSADQMSHPVWGYETFGSRNFVEAHVSRLRAKLAAAGARQVIDTLRGVGYVIR
jgi:DNA-binding response OmpR family regulator